MRYLFTRRGRAFWSAIICLLIIATILALLIAAQANATRGQPITPQGWQIDWAHPIMVQVMPAGEHSGLGTELTAGAVPLTLTPKTGLAMRPSANFPGNCYQGVAYNVVVNGKTIWTSVDVSQAYLEVNVQYLWCPTYHGDPVGINWSYGRAFPLQGCVQFAVGNHIGAFIASVAGPTFDGEQYTVYSTCAPTGVVWDDSLTVIGSGRYSVTMEGYDPDTGQEPIAQSPCCY